MSPHACDPCHVLDQYEALRREALAAAPFGPRGHGLAVFLTRGLPGWLAALTALAPRERPARGLNEGPQDRGPTLLPAARMELITVMAGMILTCTQETEGSQCTARAR